MCNYYADIEPGLLLQHWPFIGQVINYACVHPCPGCYKAVVTRLCKGCFKVVTGFCRIPATEAKPDYINCSE